jgi:hypothetical protein
MEDDDGLTDLFRKLGIVDKKEVEKTEMDEIEETEMEDEETKMIKTIIGLHEKLKELKHEKNKMSLDNLNDYMKRMTILNNDIVTCNENIKKKLPEFLDLLKKKPDENRARISTLENYSKKRHYDESVKQLDERRRNKILKKDGRKSKRRKKSTTKRKKSKRGKKSTRRKKSKK